jgi:serine phosphatase RsbU (regulator of sigma subunit)
MKAIRFLLILLLFTASFPVVAQEQHKHNFYNTLFGDGEDSFVCYNRVHRNFYAAIFFTVAGLAVVGFSRYRVKKKAAVELSRKNAIIEEKNKDITDSIRYAKRIQAAILPPSPMVRSCFPDHFILYRPKDIVSGDFYWVAGHAGKVMIAAVDCTGHGVPGAFLSIIGHSALNKAVKQEGLTRPSDILEALNREVTLTLRQDGNAELKDGMDIALCAYDAAAGTLQFAGAFNPLFVVRNGALEEIKGNRNPVGSTVKGETPIFTNHELKVSKGDVFYLFSDGYSDQFGGKDGKKFKISRMKELLVEVHNKPLDAQQALIERALEDWRGNLEQVDDVLVIGVRISE